MFGWIQYASYYWKTICFRTNANWHFRHKQLHTVTVFRASGTALNWSEQPVPGGNVTSCSQNGQHRWQVWISTCENLHLFGKIRAFCHQPYQTSDLKSRQVDAENKSCFRPRQLLQTHQTRRSMHATRSPAPSSKRHLELINENYNNHAHEHHRLFTRIHAPPYTGSVVHVRQQKRLTNTHTYTQHKHIQHTYTHR